MLFALANHFVRQFDDLIDRLPVLRIQGGKLSRPDVMSLFFVALQDCWHKLGLGQIKPLMSGRVATAHHQVLNPALGHGL